tara:strand:+ start:388 stop:837 length:450 start_codon:yes stop_codon:yes gene_type:complete
MVNKYVLTRKKLRPTLEWLSGQRKWPEGRFEEGRLTKAGAISGKWGYQRKKVTKLDEITKASDKSEKFQTKTDRDRRKRAWVKEQTEKKVDKYPSLYKYESQKENLKEKLENEFDRQSLLKGKRNKKGGSVKTSKYSQGGGVRSAKYKI